MSNQPPIFHEGVLHYDQNAIDYHEQQQQHLQEGKQLEQLQQNNNNSTNNNTIEHHQSKQQEVSLQYVQDDQQLEQQIPTGQSLFSQDSQHDHHKTHFTSQGDEIQRDIDNSESTMNSSVKLKTIFDIDCNHEINEPIINSPRSLQACKLSGFPVNSLLKRSKEYLERKLKEKISPQGLQILAENQETRRQDKIAKVIELRQKIIEGNLSKEESKLLHEQLLFKTTNDTMGYYTPQRTFSSIKSYQELPSSFLVKSETQLSQVSPYVSSKLEKTKKYHIKEIESLIEAELNLSLQNSSVEEKNRRLEEIAFQKYWEQEQKRKEIQEAQSLKRQRLYEHQLKEQAVIKEKEQNFFLKQSRSAEQINILKQHREQELQNEAQRMNERIEQAKFYVQEQRKKRHQIVERQYLSKHERFLKKQEEQQLLLAQQQQDKDEQEKAALDRKFKREMQFFAKLETVVAKLQQKHTQTEEKQRLISEIRTGKYMSRNPSRIQSATVIGSYSNNPSRSELPDEVTKELEIQEKLVVHRQRAIQALNRKQLLTAAEAKRIDEDFLKRQQQRNNKIEVSQQTQEQQKMQLKSQNIMKNLNAQDNAKRLEYLATTRNTIFTEKQAARSYQDILKSQEIAQQDKERKQAYSKLGIEKQKIKQDLERIFQKGRKVNVSEIVEKYGLPLESEEKLMSRSMANLSRPKSQLGKTVSIQRIPSKYSNTPYFQPFQSANIGSATRIQTQ